MIRKHLFSEELGRNIIWVMLSGFFLKIGAKENLFGQIVLPKEHYLFNLDETKIDTNYLNFDNLHYIFFDGSTEFLNDKRFKQIKKQTNIYYVGRLEKFWKNVKDSRPLFSNLNDDLDKNIKNVKKKYPIFFIKYFIKNFLTTVFNFKNFKLMSNHIFGRKKFVYYGYIKPTQKHLEFYHEKIGIKKYNFKIFFEETNSEIELRNKIKYLFDIKNNILNLLGAESYPYLNEFLLFMTRNLVCNILKGRKDFLIYDGLGGDHNFNAYEMLFGSQHTYLDLGSKVGFDKIYPRYALLKLFDRKIISLNLNEKSFYSTQDNENLDVYHSINNFLNKLNIKL